MRKVLLATTLLLIALPMFGQATTPELPSVQAFTARQFPSLVPVPIVKVPLAGIIGTNPKNWPIRPSSASSYKVTNTKTKQELVIARVDQPGDQDLTVAYLIMQTAFSKDAPLKVQLIKDGAVLAETKSDVKVENADKFSINVNPQAAPSAELTDGNKRDVGQFGITVDVPQLVPRLTFARTYFNTDNLISTDERDKKSKVDGKLGIERSLTSGWYLPAHVEAESQGDQVGANLSFLLGSGVKTVLPWAVTKPALYNSAFQVPLSPTFDFDIQYERRINQDAQSKLKFRSPNGMRLHEQNSLNPIRLLPGWLHDKAPWIELNGQAWYLPLEEDQNGKSKPRLEGAGDVSLLIPTAAIPFASYLQNAGTQTRIRIKYSGGADEANGFKHSHQFTAGIEVAK